MRIRTVLAIASLIISCASAATLYERGQADSSSATGVPIFTALTAAVRSQGGRDALAQRKADYDAAVMNGIPLAAAGLTAAAYADLAAQGANVVVPCEVAHVDLAEINALLAMAPGASEVPCGGFAPGAPAVADFKGTPDRPATKTELLIAEGSDSAAPCAGASGLLAEAVADAGGNSWACGSQSR